MNNLFSIGDSHAMTLFSVAKCIELGPMTMYRVGRDRINFARYLSAGSNVIFYFGEIDIRVHVDKQVKLGKNEDDIINELGTRFIEHLVSFRDKFKIIVPSITPPIDAKKSSDIEYPINGTNEDRVRYCKKLNSLLKALCLKNGLLFLDVYDLYADENGILIDELSDGSHHIKNMTGFNKALTDLIGLT